MIIILIQINPSISVFDHQTSQTNELLLQQSQQQQQQQQQQRQQFHVPHVDWNFLQRSNQTSAKSILQNEIENLKRLFPFINFHNSSKSFDSFIVLDNNNNNDDDNDNSNVIHEQQQQQQMIQPYHIQIESKKDSNDNFINNDDKDDDGNSSTTTTTTNSKNKLIDLNAILFLGLMFFILVVITLYLLNSWSSRLDRRASIQTKTADNHKQPYTISV
ncbi:hypothetical protein DERF_001397 [Dermatophagoides farinae]|uniref:Uncharacterized protein n=1 Tax=Dermatophagoides farinae TaxID=6954 RepID=A0A922L9C5_DERFA|nr:hypothetical protein DERF_001397 [Dermatophagoides farinae]